MKRIYNQLVAEGSDFVCSAKLQDLMDILGLPNELDGAVALAQSWLCGESVQGLAASSDLELAGISDFLDTVKAIFNSLVAKGSDFVCSSSLQELLALLGVPEQLEGAVKMAQGWICDSVSAKRSAIAVMPAAVQMQCLQGFQDTVNYLYNKLKNYMSAFVCSSRLPALLDLLGVSDELDGAVELAQQMICGKVTALSFAVNSSAALEGFVEQVRAIYEYMVEMGKSLACESGIEAILEDMGLPSALIWAANIALGWLGCEE